MAQKNDSMEHSIWHEIVGTWSTPYVIKEEPYGVLHVAVDMDLCGGSLSTPYGTKTNHMEYSIWHEIVATWSTPWGSRNKSSGALCISSTVDIVYNSMKHSI